MTQRHKGFDPALVVAERLRSALRPRNFGFRLAGAGSGYCLLYLDSGEGAVSVERETRLVAPALLWLPWQGAAQLRLAAGASGIYALFAEPLLSAAIGHNADAQALWRLSRLGTVIDLAQDRPLRQECAAAMTVLEREVLKPGTGSESLIESQIRHLLVQLWRHGQALEAGDDPSPATSFAILQRFRQLVEAHFRQRWTVRAYAEALGVTPDRLHDICQRNLARPPGRLIRERLGREASELLQRSPMSLEQIAAELGFADAAQFSRFVRSETGLPPARYRRRFRASMSDAGMPDPGNHADWP